MAANKRNDSIIQRVDNTGRFFTLALICFMVLNLLMMYAFQRRYDRFATEVAGVAALKPVVSDEIPDEIWEVITGRKRMEDCLSIPKLDAVAAVLDQIKPTKREETELLVARRSLETMRSYVSQIAANILQRKSVLESQELLKDLRDVGSLTEDLLEDYMTKRVEVEQDTNARSRVLFICCCVGEAMLWVVMTFFSTITNRNLSDYIGDQIQQLEDFAGQLADGQMNARAPDMQTRELQPLTESLNTMAERLNSLMLQNKTEQDNLKKSELRTLQAQINPHFLYNTLDAIMWQAEAKNSSEVIHITAALSDFFRISLSSGEEWITVAQEKRHLEGYLSIQKVRYRDILEYSVEIDPDIEDEIVLKLLLQPLVENALYHGIKPRRGGGLIRVTGRREGKDLCFCVQDNGAGISPERLQEVRASLKDNNIQLISDAEGGSGFGLKNVDLRIRLYYAKEEGLTIESDAGGTKVSFRLPAGMKGTEEHV